LNSFYRDSSSLPIERQMNSTIQRMYGEVGRTLRLKIPVGPERKAKKQAEDPSFAIDFFTQGIASYIGYLIALWKLVNAILSY
jgi:hypothetical protein